MFEARNAELVAQDAIRELGVLDVAPVADLAGPQQREPVVVDEPGVVRDLRPVELGIDVRARLQLRQRLVEVLRQQRDVGDLGREHRLHRVQERAVLRRVEQVAARVAEVRAGHLVLEDEDGILRHLDPAIDELQRLALAQHARHHAEMVDGGGLRREHGVGVRANAVKDLRARLGAWFGGHEVLLGRLSGREVRAPVRVDRHDPGPGNLPNTGGRSAGTVSTDSPDWASTSAYVQGCIQFAPGISSRNTISAGRVNENVRGPTTTSPGSRTARST